MLLKVNLVKSQGWVDYIPELCDDSRPERSEDNSEPEGHPISKPEVRAAPRIVKSNKAPAGNYKITK